MQSGWMGINVPEDLPCLPVCMSFYTEYVSGISSSMTFVTIHHITVCASHP